MLATCRPLLLLQYGLLTIIAGFIGILGLPVFASHTWAAYRYFKAASAARRGVAPGMMPMEQNVTLATMLHCLASIHEHAC